MFSLFNLFSSPPKLSFKDFQTRKNQLKRLLHYYQDKIDYLSNPKIPPALATIVCRDVPRNLTKQLKNSGQRHIKVCLRYYKKRLFEVGKELKKFL